MQKLIDKKNIEVQQQKQIKDEINSISNALKSADIETADRKVILQAVSLNESEMELLGKFHQNGCEVAIQIVPEDTRLSYEEIVKKYKEK